MPWDVIGRTGELAAIDRFLARIGGGLACLAAEARALARRQPGWRRSKRPRIAASRSFGLWPYRSEETARPGGLGDLPGDVSCDAMSGLPDSHRLALDVALLRQGRSVRPRISAPSQSRRRTCWPTWPRLWVRSPSRSMTLDGSTRVPWRSSPSRSVASKRVGSGSSWQCGNRARAPAARSANRYSARAGRDFAAWPAAPPARHRMFLEDLALSFSRLILVRIQEVSGGNPFCALGIGRGADPYHRPQSSGVVPLPVPETLAALDGARPAALSRFPQIGVIAPFVCDCPDSRFPDG